MDRAMCEVTDVGVQYNGKEIGAISLTFQDTPAAMMFFASQMQLLAELYKEPGPSASDLSQIAFDGLLNTLRMFREIAWTVLDNSSEAWDVSINMLDMLEESARATYAQCGSIGEFTMYGTSTILSLAARYLIEHADQLPAAACTCEEETA